MNNENTVQSSRTRTTPSFSLSLSLLFASHFPHDPCGVWPEHHLPFPPGVLDPEHRCTRCTPNTSTKVTVIATHCSHPSPEMDGCWPAALPRRFSSPREPLLAWETDLVRAAAGGPEAERPGGRRLRSSSRITEQREGSRNGGREGIARRPVVQVA